MDKASLWSCGRGSLALHITCGFVHCTSTQKNNGKNEARLSGIISDGCDDRDYPLHCGYDCVAVVITLDGFVSVPQFEKLTLKLKTKVE